jgi:hypothetical protein
VDEYLASWLWLNQGQGQGQGAFFMPLKLAKIAVDGFFWSR